MEQKKSNVCGECRWFSEGGNRCKLFINQYIFGDREACNNFASKKITNGDVIRQGGNAAIAEFSWSDPCLHCAYSSGKCKRPVDKTCKDGQLAWLNAPAKEGEEEK